MLPLPLLCVLAFCCSTDGASLLAFFPFPGRSHHRLFAPLAAGLASRGHRITYYSPLPLEQHHRHPNITEVMLPDLAPEILGSIDMYELGQMWIPTHLNLMYSKMRELLAEIYQTEAVRGLLASEDLKFDAVLLESFFFQESNSALLHRFDAPGIELVPLGDFLWVSEISGVRPHTSYVADYKTLLRDRLTLGERLYNTLTTAGALLTSYYNTCWAAQRLMDEHLRYPGWEDRPPLTLLAANRSLILVNKSPYLGYPHPTAPHLKLVGGINVLPPKPLPKAIQDFMDGAEHGVVYMSLGLNMKVSQMMERSIQHFISVFRRLPQRVLLKWEASPIDDLPPNVLTSETFPQVDILAHPKCSLFVTHGGVLSLFESAHHAVPVLGIPFYGDQPRNILWAQSVGIGLHLDLANISESSVSWALGELLGNQRYRSEVRRRSAMLKDEHGPDRSPLDEALRLIEQAIKYPNALTPASAYQPAWVLHQIDVDLLLLLAAGGLLLLARRYITGPNEPRTGGRKLKGS